MKRHLLLIGCLMALCAAGPAFAQSKGQNGPPPAAQPAQIDRNGVLILIRSTLLALHQANETGNYTVLRDLAAPAFQQANTAARLSEIFANLRGQNLDLSGVAVLDPQLTLLPQIEPNGMMRLAGFFPSIPLQINFELIFAPVDGRWRPFGISVGVSSSSPVAPKPPQANGAKTGEPDKPMGGRASEPGRNSTRPGKPHATSPDEAPLPQ